MVISPIGVLLNNKKQTTFAIKENSGNNNIAYLPDINCKQPSFSNIKAYHQVISFSGAGLKRGLFKDLAVNELHPLWDKLIARESSFVQNKEEIRHIFKIDYDKILHSGAYNRMAAKTQVFSHPQSDMTTTRILHVNQVAAIAEDIAEALGLNTKLTRAIAIGHDIGHAPFGHAGERGLNNLIKKYNLKPAYWQDGFYHEKNSMRFADDIETELDELGHAKNLNLTYAVRDGIISHCGEVDENGLKPRLDYVDLRSIQKNSRPQPFTWEACVVKISDKISYLGKDIEDALNNKFLKPEQLNELKSALKESIGEDFKEINNTVLKDRFVSDLVKNSSPEEGLKFSEKTLKLINTVKKFNYEKIYLPKDKIQALHYDAVLNTIFENLNNLYSGKKTLEKLDQIKEKQPVLASVFRDWLVKYSDINLQEKGENKLSNKVIYSIENPDDYKLSIIEFMSGMTDKFAVKSYDEVIKFG